MIHTLKHRAKKRKEDEMKKVIGWTTLTIITIFIGLLTAPYGIVRVQ